MDAETFRQLADGKAAGSKSKLLSDLVKQIAAIILRFLLILKYKFNHYWVQDIVYDTRVGNAGYYAHLLGLSLRRDGETVRLLLPSTSKASFTIMLDTHAEDNAIREADIAYLIALMQDNQFEVTLLDKKVMETFVHIVNSEIDEAPVSLGTVANLFIERFLRARLLDGYSAKPAYNRLHSTTKARDILLLVLAARSVSPDSVQKITDCIDRRNEVVHEGKSFQNTPSLRFAVLASLKVLSSAFEDRSRKFPLHNVG